MERDLPDRIVSGPWSVRRVVTFLAVALVLLTISCRTRLPQIAFRSVPEASVGGPDTRGIISGTVTPADPSQRIVIYTRTADGWWVQPVAEKPFTAIQPDGSWSTETHLGLEFAALLVRDQFHPSAFLTHLPTVGGSIVVVTRVPASTNTAAAADVARNGGSGTPIEFSGYRWVPRSAPSSSGGKNHNYSAANVWVDPAGSLHLAMRLTPDGWSCSEVHSTRSFGYGTYRFTLHGVGHFEPAVMLSLNTWKDEIDDASHREIDIHVSRWGVPQNKNAEYVTQPYFVPSNVYRFEMPKGPVVTSFIWKPGIVSFKTVTADTKSPQTVSQWNFTTDVPTSGGELTYMTFCVFAFSPTPLQHNAEVVIDRFEFLP